MDILIWIQTSKPVLLRVQTGGGGGNRFYYVCKREGGGTGFTTCANRRGGGTGFTTCANGGGGALEIHGATTTYFVACSMKSVEGLEYFIVCMTLGVERL